MTYGIVGIVAGTDLITHWEQYVSPIVLHMLPITPTHFMYLVSIVEIGVGILILAWALI